MTSAADRFAPGARVGDLTIVRLLGRGGFGTVYLAHDRVLGRLVALKVLPTSGPLALPDARRRLRHEARMAARLTGPHGVRLYAMPRMPRGWVGLMYEYVEGGSLAERLESAGRLAPEQTAQVLDGVLAALEEAGAHGVVHRDVTPRNVLFDAAGQARLADFGQASLAHQHLLVAGGRVAGTPSYVAPELYEGRPPTPAADLWSVGVLAFRCLAGYEPFPAEDAVALFFAVQNDPLPPLPADVPAAWTPFLSALLAKRPEERPADAAAARRLLAPLRAVGGATAARAPSTLPTAAPGLVGREAEVQRLDRALRDLVEGHGGALALLGEAGLGKSALVGWVRQVAPAAGVEAVEVAFASGEGLWRGLSRALRERRRRGQGLALLDAGRPEPLARALRVLLGEASAGESAEHSDQALWALESLLQALAAERPLLLVAEDLHLAPPGDLALLRAVARRLAGARVLLLVTARTGSDVGGPGAEPALAELAEGGAFPLDARLVLAPLPREQVDRLLTQAAGGAAPTAEVLAHVARQGGGNPLWTLELLAHLEREGAVARRGADLVATERFAQVGVPRTYRALVEERVRALPESDRELLEIAAVDGIDVDAQALASVAGRDLLDVLRRLQALLRTSGVVASGPRGARFAHALLRDALYESLLPEYRAELHRRLAESLEGRPGAPEAERVGTHWEQAGDRARASPHLLLAALQAAHRQEHARTIALLERGGLVPGRIAPEQARAHADLLLMAVHAYAGQQGRAAARLLLADLERAAASLGLRPLALRAAVESGRLRVYWDGPQAVDPAPLAEAAVELAPSKSAASALYVLGLLAKFQGRLDEAELHFTASRDMYAALGLLGQSASASAQRAAVALRRGDAAAAERLYREASQASRQAGRPIDAALSEANAVLAAADDGRDAGLVPSLERAVRDLDLAGAVPQRLHLEVHLARARFSSGVGGDVRAGVRGLMASLRAASYAPGLLDATEFAAELALAAEDLSEAAALLGEIQRLDAATGFRPGRWALGLHLQLARGDALAAPTVELRDQLGSAAWTASEWQAVLHHAVDVATQGASAAWLEVLTRALDDALPRLAAAPRWLAPLAPHLLDGVARLASQRRRVGGDRLAARMPLPPFLWRGPSLRLLWGWLDVMDAPRTTAPQPREAEIIRLRAAARQAGHLGWVRRFERLA